MKEILKKAIISEKSFAKASDGKFTFLVNNNARKSEISAVFESVFGQKPLKINTISIEGKVKRTKKGMGKRSDIKKAIITCKKDTKIDLFEIEDKKQK